MKKYFSLFVVVLMAGLVLSSSNVRAEDGTGDAGSSNNGSNNRGEMRATMQANRETFRAKMQEERQAFADSLKAKRDTFKTEVEKRKEEFKNATREMKGLFRGKAQEMVGQRFEEAIKNLENVQARVQTAIDKQDADGKNTDDASNYLDLSKQKLADAKAKIDEIKALLPDTDEKVTADVFEQIKLKAREAKDLLKESRGDLVDAIKEIKSLKGEDTKDEPQP